MGTQQAQPKAIALLGTRTEEPMVGKQKPLQASRVPGAKEGAVIIEECQGRKVRCQKPRRNLKLKRNNGKD